MVCLIEFNVRLGRNKKSITIIYDLMEENEKVVSVGSEMGTKTHVLSKHIPLKMLRRYKFVSFLFKNMVLGITHEQL